MGRNTRTNKYFGRAALRSSRVSHGGRSTFLLRNCEAFDHCNDRQHRRVVKSSKPDQGTRLYFALRRESKDGDRILPRTVPVVLELHPAPSGRQPFECNLRHDGDLCEIDGQRVRAVLLLLLGNGASCDAHQLCERRLTDTCVASCLPDSIPQSAHGGERTSCCGRGN